MSTAVLAAQGYASMLLALTEGLVATAHLYTNDPLLTDASVRADFVEVIDDWYSPIGITTWSPPTMRGGVAFTVADHLVWVYPNAGEGPTVRGYYVTAGPDGPLLWAWRAPDPPFTFSEAGPTLLLFVTLFFPPTPPSARASSPASPPTT